MKRSKIALGILLSLGLAAASVACNGPDPIHTGSGSTIVDPDISGCNPATDSDPITAVAGPFTITHLGLPGGMGDGFNLDGINNSPAPSGSGTSGPTGIAGCGKVDITGGIDNALAGIAASLMSVIDLNGALQDTVRHADGGAGSLNITVTGTHVGSGPNDSCIGVDVHVTSSGAAPTDTHFFGKGALIDNVAHMQFDETINFVVGLTVPAASCVGMVCNNGATLTIAVHNARARATFDAAHTAIQSGSILGGFIFFEDTSGGYDAQNPTGFKAALTAYATSVGLAPSFRDMAIQAFAGARDLHMNADGTLSPCTGANSSTVDKNAVSVALALDSLP